MLCNYIAPYTKQVGTNTPCMAFMGLKDTPEKCFRSHCPVCPVMKFQHHAWVTVHANSREASRKGRKGLLMSIYLILRAKCPSSVWALMRSKNFVIPELQRLDTSGPNDTK